MAITLPAALRNARADQITTFAGANAKLRIYTASYATQLLECVCAATLAPAASGGVLTFNAVASGTATASGTAATARLYKSDGTTLVIDGLVVGVTGSGQPVQLTNLTIATGDTVAVSAGTITEGNP